MRPARNARRLQRLYPAVPLIILFSLTLLYHYFFCALCCALIFAYPLRHYPALRLRCTLIFAYPNGANSEPILLKRDLVYLQGM